MTKENRITLSLQFHFDDLMRIVYQDSVDVREYLTLRENYDPKCYEHFLSISGFWSTDLYDWLSNSLIKYQKTGKASKKLKSFILDEIDKLKVRNEIELKDVIQKEQANPQRGFIYLIKSGEYYKIGRAKDIDSRIKTYYKTENPLSIKILLKKEVDDYVEVEKKLLEEFKDKKYRGEWFRFNKSDIIKVREMVNQYRI